MCGVCQHFEVWCAYVQSHKFVWGVGACVSLWVCGACVCVYVCVCVCACVCACVCVHTCVHAHPCTQHIQALKKEIVTQPALCELQVRPVRIANCNLHGSTTRAGITGVVEQVSIKQYMNCAQSRVDAKHTETWLEAGGFALGPITVEAAMALPNPQLHHIQDEFLRVHDDRHKRLWFLWPPNPAHPASSNCGCLGGCEFFGSNKKGATFFKSRKQRESSQIAIPQVCSAGHDPGFGQSLLHEGKLVFEVGQNGLRMSPNKVSPTQFSFTRGYMSDLASPDGTDDAVARSSEGSVLEGTASSSATLQTAPFKGTEEMSLLREQIAPRGAGMRPLSSHSDSLAFQTSMPAGAVTAEPRQDTLSLSDQSSLQDRLVYA